MLVDRLLAHSFIKVAAVTDHDSVRGCKTAMALAAAYPDILIIPGVEITTPQGDMLVLGTEELPPRPWDPQSVADFAKSIGGVSVVAHPYRQYGLGDLARNLKVDAIEVLNGGASAAENDEAKALAKSLGLPGTAGSDAHQMSDLFCVNCRIDAALNVDAVVRALKKGLVSAQVTQGSIRF